MFSKFITISFLECLKWQCLYLTEPDDMSSFILITKLIIHWSSIHHTHLITFKPWNRLQSSSFYTLKWIVVHWMKASCKETGIRSICWDSSGIRLHNFKEDTLKPIDLSYQLFFSSSMLTIGIIWIIDCQTVLTKKRNVLGTVQ